MEKALEKLQEVLELEEARLSGLDHVDLYVNDVEGDWLETWEED